jgi:TIR domain
MSGLSDVKAFFLSHAGEDKEFVRGVAARASIAGRAVFLDEWSIEYGESIPGAISSALHEYPAVAVFWSFAAEASAWVRREFQSAVTRFIDDPGRVLVVIRLDDTDVPELIRDLKWIDGRNGDVDAAANALLGFDSRSRGIAIQNHLETLGLRPKYFEGYGVAIACPRCGADASQLEAFYEWGGDGEHEYSGAKCTECEWQRYTEYTVG